jgi:hypothetical protein
VAETSLVGSSGEAEAEAEEVVESGGGELSLESVSVSAGSGELGAEVDADEEFGAEVGSSSGPLGTGAEYCAAPRLEVACGLVMGLRIPKPNRAIAASANKTLNHRRPITPCTLPSPRRLLHVLSAVIFFVISPP